MNEQRNGGRLTILAGVIVALILLMGSGFQLGFVGKPSIEVFTAMIIVVVVFTVIGVGIGCYNLGRERGR